MKFLERYSSGSNTIHQKSAWNKLLKALIRIVGTYTAVTLVLIFIWLQFIAPFIMKELPGIRGAGISLVLILLLIAPMLRAIMMKKNHSAEFQQLWLDSKYNRGPLVSLVILLYYIMYRPSHAARRPFVECYSRYRTGDRSNRHRYCHFIQTAEKTIHPDGTTFFQ